MHKFVEAHGPHSKKVTVPLGAPPLFSRYGGRVGDGAAEDDGA